MQCIEQEVAALLNKNENGHGMEHVLRVVKLASRFAKQEKANLELTTLIALLHDVDDYKLFGQEDANSLNNAKRIMKDCKIDVTTQEQVLQAIHEIGFGKRLKGITPTSLEAKVVSDADMCDASGINGILRAYAYNLSFKRPFFKEDAFPILNISGAEYTTRTSEATMDHIFEKILRLKDFMLTNSGKKEATIRHEAVVSVLQEFFREEDNATWQNFLNEYLKNN
jgi:uncharacterized protein